MVASTASRMVLWRWLARAPTQAGLCRQISTLRATGPALALGVLFFSQCIETQSAAELIAGLAEGVGYLLNDSVAEVSQFVDAITRVACGGTVLDPEVVRYLLSAGRRADALAVLTPREREVLALMAQGRSNTANASEFTISPRIVEKHWPRLRQARPRAVRQGQPPGPGHDQVPRVLACAGSRPLAGQGGAPALTRLLPRPCGWAVWEPMSPRSFPFHPVHTMRLASRADQLVRRAPARRFPARDRSAIGS